ncbi:hypothetical protein ABPG77_008008 [Micractinium sp. CCAP 211/92]
MPGDVGAMGLNSSSRSIEDLEACWAEGPRLRSTRPSCADLSALAAVASWEDRPLLCSKTRSAAALSAAAAGAHPPPGLRGSPHASGTAVAVAVRRSWRRAVSAALALTLALVLLTQHRQLYRHGQDAAAKLYYGLDPNMLGRSEALFPAPHCCRDEACSGGGSQQRVAVVTYLRDDSYLPLLQQLDCTLRRSNPHLELGLMHVEGELAPATLQLVRALNITLLPVAPLEFPNTYEARYGRNWLKVRALGLTQYDAVLLVDSDVAVVSRGLDSIFSLPVEFAAVWDQSKWLNRWRTVVDHINGGVFLLRPCAAVEAHMVHLLDAHPKLRFVHGTAEQDFFGWYYRYTGATLPLQWNCQAEQCLENSATVGGARPKIVHFTDHKPFSGRRPGTHGHEFLCSTDELAQRAQGLLPAAAGLAAAGGTGAPEGQQQGEQPAAADGAGPAQHVQQQVQQQPGDAAPAAAQLGVPAPATGSGAAVQQQRLVQHALQQLDEQRLKHLDIVQQGNKKLPG